MAIVSEDMIKLEPDALEQLERIYDLKCEKQMGDLHNRFVAFISESKLPIPKVLLVLELLKQETLDLARQKYLGG